MTFCLQIHEFYEEFEEARSVLRAYRAKNPDNPNAHRLLYEHLQRHWEQCGEGSVQEEIVSCLKVSGAGVSYPAGRSWFTNCGSDATCLGCGSTQRWNCYKVEVVDIQIP